MLKNTKKGFTLIELLVVIAIIGILASVVLASLNTARSKGADAAVKASLNNARAQAELFYDPSGTYANVCTTATTANPGGILSMITGAVAQSAAPLTAAVHNAAGAALTTTCNDGASGWAAEVPLKGVSGSYWCVDSSGVSKQEAGTSFTVGTDYTCL